MPSKPGAGPGRPWAEVASVRGLSTWITVFFEDDPMSFKQTWTLKVLLEMGTSRYQVPVLLALITPLFFGSRSWLANKALENASIVTRRSQNAT